MMKKLGTTTRWIAAVAILSANMTGTAAAIMPAGTVAKGHVLHTGTYGNGDVFVLLDTQVNEPGCPDIRVDIPSTHPMAKSWLAVASTALAARSLITVRTTGCFTLAPSEGYPAHTSPTIDQSGSGWFHLSIQ